MNYDENVRTHLEILEKELPFLKTDAVEYAEAFSCPFALTTIRVIESSEKDLSFSDGMVLYMYDLGFRQFDKMASLSSIPIKVVMSSFNLLANVDGLISESEDCLTPLGKEALGKFKVGEYNHMVHVRSQRNLQIEAITGSVVPSFLEMKDLFFEPSDTLPCPFKELERLEIDEMVYNEITSRLSDYNKSHIENGNNIIGIEKFNVNRIMYGDCILVKYKEITNPLIIPMLSNNELLKIQQESDLYDGIRIYPISYSESEKVELPKLIKRSNNYFSILKEYISKTGGKNDG